MLRCKFPFDLSSSPLAPRLLLWYPLPS
jgi:hypothetical protein